MYGAHYSGDDRRGDIDVLQRGSIMSDDPFVEDHRKEIERMAYHIYKSRECFKQEDDPGQNFIQAISIIRRQYQEKESHHAK